MPPTAQQSLRFGAKAGQSEAQLGEVGQFTYEGCGSTIGKFYAWSHPMKVIQLSMKDITYDSIYLGQIFCRLVTRSIKITWKALPFHACPLMVNSYWVEGLPWKSSQEFRYQSYGTHTQVCASHGSGKCRTVLQGG